MGALLILCCAMILVVIGVMVFRMHAFLVLISVSIVVTQLTSWGSVFRSQVDPVSARVISSTSGEITIQRPPKWKMTETTFAVLPPNMTLHSNSKLDILELTADASSAGRYTVSTDPAPATGSLLIPIRKYENAIELANDSPAHRVAEGFGETAMKIGILIAMAAVLGRCLLVSGAAQSIVDKIRGVCGEQNTPIAFVISSFVLSIPLFFDTVFLLLLPLAKAMYLQTGRDYVKYVLSIVVGGTLAHSLVPPTPGPLLVAAELNISMPIMFMMGIFIGCSGIVAGYAYLNWINRMLPITMREESLATAPVMDAQVTTKPPSFLLSVLPIILPMCLLALDFLWPWLQSQQPAIFLASLTPAIHFLGDKNIALTLSALFAFFTLWSIPGMSTKETSKQIQSALAEGGTVLLIICAGGALGSAIQQTNISSALINTFPAINSGSGLLVAAFLVTTMIRVAQGSATVAMITAVGIFAPLAATMTLPFHPVYLAMAIGCGSKPLPWMNDAGFWVIGKMSGFTEKETFQTFSVLLTIMGVAAFATTLIASIVFPLI
jgi:GntP family gluconate:H+ symporter